MKIEINCEALADALAKCGAAVTGKTTLPVLSCVLIRAEGKSVTITGSNLDIDISCTVPANVIAPGSWAVPFKALSIIAKNEGEMSLEVDKKGKVVIRVGSSRFTFGSLAADEFPESTECAAGKFASVSPEEWASAAARTLNAASADETRYMLCGILLTQRDGMLSMVATNGHCLALVETEIGWDAERDTTVPTLAMGAILKAIDGADDMQVAVSDGKIHVKADDCRISAKMIEANFPNWKQVMPLFPEADCIRLKMGKADLLKGVSKLGALLSGSGIRSVILSIAESALTLQFRGADGQEASTEVEAEIDGKDLEIALNADRITSLMRPLGDEITIRLLDGMSPVKVTEGNATVILMPMRITQ